MKFLLTIVFLVAAAASIDGTPDHLSEAHQVPSSFQNGLKWELRTVPHAPHTGLSQTSYAQVGVHQPSNGYDYQRPGVHQTHVKQVNVHEPDNPHTAVHQSTYQHAGHQVPTYNQGRVHQATYKHAGAPLPTYNQVGTPVPTYNQVGAPVPPYNQVGAPVPPYNQVGTPVAIHNQVGVPVPPYNQVGVPVPTFKSAGVPVPTYNDVGAHPSTFKQLGVYNTPSKDFQEKTYTRGNVQQTTHDIFGTSQPAFKTSSVQQPVPYHDVMPEPSVQQAYIGQEPFAQIEVHEPAVKQFEVTFTRPGAHYISYTT